MGIVLMIDFVCLFISSRLTNTDELFFAKTDENTSDAVFAAYSSDSSTLLSKSDLGSTVWLVASIAETFTEALVDAFASSLTITSMFSDTSGTAFLFTDRKSVV